MRIGDYFAVKITEDPVFGTPVFTTMGGESLCPGEYGTNARESKVEISDIVARCPCPDSNKNNCPCINLAPNEAATFGLIITNLSPTRNNIYIYIYESNDYI